MRLSFWQIFSNHPEKNGSVFVFTKHDMKKQNTKQWKGESLLIPTNSTIS